MTQTPAPQRGDVADIGYADPPPKDGGPKHRTPKPDERVAIRLHGHPYRYVVRVASSKGAEPKLAELTIIADDAAQPVGYEALRSVPARRLAYSARQWIARAGNAFAQPGDYSETHTRPQVAATAPNDRLADLLELIEHAIMDGLPVRPTVAKRLRISTATLDRMIRKARAEGLLEGIEIPRRPSPRQRDALLARHLAEEWNAEHGPDVEPPPELLAELDRLRRQTTDRNQEADQ